MNSPCLNEFSELFSHGCCPNSLSFTPQHRDMTRSSSTCAASRRDFAETTSSSIFPNSQFTNHESLPSLQESFTVFTTAYPQYYETTHVDQIRAREYYHLTVSKHTCLDYVGVGLFSYSQSHEDESCSYSSTAIPRSMHFPFFHISYKSGNLKTQLLYKGKESQLEAGMKQRIMSFLNISENDYSMIFTTSRASAFKLLAESYPFQANKKLLTVYDHENDAVEAMIKSSEKKGAHIMSAEFSWPRLRVHSTKLREMMVNKNRKNTKKQGLFVLPLHSSLTGARYSYLWMRRAEENNWHSLIDACALGPKNMDSFGFSLFRPDFLVCSFYNIFGENPLGFGCLFVKKSTLSILESSSSSAGIVQLVPPGYIEDSSGTDIEPEQPMVHKTQACQSDSNCSLTNPFSCEIGEEGESSRHQNLGVTAEAKELDTSKNGEKVVDSSEQGNVKSCSNEIFKIECKGLDQVDSLGQTLISNRARYLINWLVSSLRKLKHPNTEATSIVKIYGSKIRFDRGPALAFNVFDWKGEKVEPVLLQKLADRSNISLGYGFLHHIWFSDKYKEEKGRVLEKRGSGVDGIGASKKPITDLGITVVTAALGFLTNFEDVYKLWAFIAQFLDADFVEKERWRYTALNQKTVEV